MAQFSMTKRVAASVERVFEVASDLERAAERIRGIERIELLTEGPMRVGTRWRETRKMMGQSSTEMLEVFAFDRPRSYTVGCESTETLEVFAFDRPRSYTVGCESCGAYFETTFRFEPDGDGTLVTLDARTEARSLVAKLMSPIGNAMFGKMMRKCMGDDLEDLARAAEGQA